MIGSGALLDSYIEWEREWDDARKAERLARRLEAGRPVADWWASSLGKCYRVQVARRLGLEPSRHIDDKVRRSFAWGESIEGFLRAVHGRLGVVRGSQVYLYDEALSVS